MLGLHRGFLSYLKEKVPDLLAVHCVIHRQHLVAKRLSDRLHRSLQYVITAVNKIKSSAMRERLFSQLCEENDEDFNRLLLHTEVRWLSKGACLSRFYVLFDTVVQFLETEDMELRDNVEKSRADIAYMSDLYLKFNEMNLQLQGDQLSVIKTKMVVTAFIGKLAIFGQNLGRGEYRQFPSLNDLKQNGSLPDDVVRSFCDHLSMLHEDMCERYRDILSMVIPDWVLDPFASLAGVGVTYQEELIEMQANDELKPKIKGGYTSFWLQQEIIQLYPSLWNVAKKFLIPFPSSYLVERGFSAVTDLLGKRKPPTDRPVVALSEIQCCAAPRTASQPDLHIMLSLSKAQKIEEEETQCDSCTLKAPPVCN
uniref:HAT C-terminal dimerisation domain-containing protein n=1 Tax=Trichuris muris TaxID=70415 RepID=A0A5S6QVI8_TRIMR